MSLYLPCPNVLRDCDCEDFPVQNFSVEQIDQNHFFGHYNVPPNIGTWFAPTCLGTCESTESQQAADDCAQAAAVECSFDGAPVDGNPTPNGAHPPARFGNTVQECEALCADGNGVTLVIPANTVITGTQADADARAHALACKRAAELRVCFVTPSPLTSISQDEFASIPIVAEGGNGDYEFIIVGGAIPTGMTFDGVGLLFGIPTVAGTYTFTVTVTDTGGGSATKTYQIEVTVVAVPCSVFITDNTSYESFALAGPVSNATWTGLAHGAFDFRLVSGAYKFFDNNCPIFSEDQFWVSALSQMTWTTTNAQNGTLTNQSHSYANCGGGSTFGWMTEAEAVTDYQTGTQAGFSNANEPNAFTCDTTLNCNVAPPTASSPIPIFKLVRTQKLVATQPETMQIENLVSRANSEFTVAYGGDTTAGISVDAVAATVQTALNLLPDIIAEGGVVCAGTLAAGLTVTWNNNGARDSLDPNISTVSPGWSCEITETQAGTGGQPEIQTLMVAPFCSLIVQDSILPVYTGALGTRELSFNVTSLKWYDTLTPDPNAPTEQISGIQFPDARVTLACCPAAPSTAPTLANAGAGLVEAGDHTYAVAFVSNLPVYANPVPGFTTGASPVGPTADITLGVASSVDLTNIPLGPAGTTSRKLYRTRVGETELRELDTLNDNTTTIYTDNIADADLLRPPSPAENFWYLSITGVFDFAGTKLTFAMWQGYKASGLDPDGVYHRYFLSNGLDNRLGCGSTYRSTPSITLTGTF